MSSDFPESPWSQQIGETQVWYRRFQTYLRLTPKRSILGAYREEIARKSQKKPDSTPHSWRDAAIKFKWQERAIAWDIYEHEIQVEEMRQEAREWRKQQKALAEALLDRATEMLNFPLTIEEQEEDSEGIKKIIHPTRWTQKDIPAFINTANELARQAFDMDKPRLDEIAAIEILIKAGWIPASILDKALCGVRSLKESMQSAFRSDPR